MITASRKPDSVSSEKATPETPRSERTIFWMHTESPVERWSKEKLSVADRPVGKQRSKTISYRINKSGGSAHIQVSLLLPRKRGIRQIFRSGGRPNSHIGGELVVLV